MAVDAPAGSVSGSGDTVKSALRVAVLPEKSSAIAWSAAKVTPFVISTVSVAASPSAISTGSTDTPSAASSSSSTVTVAVAVSTASA